MNALKIVDLPDGKPPLALELPPETSFEHWVTIGRGLCLGSQALNWHIGDWWAFGDHRYGERAKAAAEGIFGREFQSLADMASVARSYEPSRRREHLSFTHHREVAALPAGEADELLEKAEREHLSTRDLRREVQALKAANDQDGVAAESRAEQPSTAEANLSWPELLKAYEAVVDFADALQEYRVLSKGERNALETAWSFLDTVYSKRQRIPDDFEVMFREHGFDGCEAHYRRHKTTIRWWLRRCGKRRLTKDRADFISYHRSRGEWITHSTKMVEHREVSAPSDEPAQQAYAADKDYALASEAANFLRMSRYGGWRISPAAAGEWFVGTVRKTSADLLRMAERQGFDTEATRLALQGDDREGVS